MIRSAAHFVRLAVLLAGATATVTAQTPAPAPVPAASGSRMITPNFTNVPIDMLAGWKECYRDQYGNKYIANCN